MQSAIKVLRVRSPLARFQRGLYVVSMKCSVIRCYSHYCFVFRFFFSSTVCIYWVYGLPGVLPVRNLYF